MKNFQTNDFPTILNQFKNVPHNACSYKFGIFFGRKTEGYKKLKI